MDQQQAITLMIVSFGAFFVPLLCRFINISAAVGEVLFGILVGPSLLGLIESDAILSFLGNIGFIILMFMAGLEIDFNYLKRLGKNAAFIALIAVSISFTLSFLVAPLLDWPFFLGLFLAALSLGLPISLLYETKTSTSTVGQVILLVGSIGEFLTIILFTVLTVVHTSGFSWVLMQKMLQLGLLFFVIAVILRSFMLLVWLKPEIFQRLASDGDPQEIGMRLTMFLMFFFVALAAVFEVKMVLGAFIGGALLAFIFRETSPIEEKISNLGFGFLIPIFFIHVGATFDPSSLAPRALITTVPVVFILVVFIKIIPLLLLKFIGMTFPETIMTGVVLACPLTLMVAAAELSLAMEIIDIELYSLLLVVALLLALIMPLVYKSMLHRGNPPVSEEDVTHTVPA